MTGRPLLNVSLCRTDQHQQGASSSWQRRPSHHFCPNKRPGRVREAPKIRGGRGANLRLRRADLFPVHGFRLWGSPEHLRRDMVPFSVFFCCCSLPIVVANAGLCLLFCMGTRFQEGLGEGSGGTKFSDAFRTQPEVPQRNVGWCDRGALAGELEAQGSKSQL